jgi:hypothetical protein
MSKNFCATDLHGFSRIMHLLKERGFPGWARLQHRSVASGKALRARESWKSGAGKGGRAALQGHLRRLESVGLQTQWSTLHLAAVVIAITGARF